ncbi:MAG: FAD-binding oxidoreductase [Desulfobacteraceae bacterium]|nr:FAD-binding oxidoreductase [Desulfobacteraceae bacterium]
MTETLAVQVNMDEVQSPQWHNGVEQIRRAIGNDHVFVDPASIETRSKVIIPFARRPSAFIYPGTVAEIEQIVRIANEYQIALWPVSKGKNWGYGSATPCRAGAVVVGLERLDRILEVNTEMAYAVIEPGVTYRQLHQYLIERDLPLWLDCTDGPADASVMGNALERGVGETPYGDHFENICGMEVILPTGKRVQTGGGPLDSYRSWHTHKWGVGPYLEGLFSQSNYGIVTKMGIWLMPRPEKFVSCLFELRREEDFPEMIEALRRLQFGGAIRSKVHIVNDFINFAVVDKYPHHLLQGGKCLSAETQHQLRQAYNIAPWTFAAGLYGSAAQVRVDMRMVKKELGHLGSLQFISDRKIQSVQKLTRYLQRLKNTQFGSAAAERLSMGVFKKPLSVIEFLPHLHAIEKGVPSDYFVKHAYYKSRRPKPADNDINPPRDNIGLIWLGPMIPLNGRQVSEVLDLCRPLYAKHQFEFSTALMIANPRSVIALMSIFFDKEDIEETLRAEALYFEMGKVTQAAGYQQYRTSTAYMDRILDPAPEFKELTTQIKQALDPNNVMAPGKYGVGV